MNAFEQLEDNMHAVRNAHSITRAIRHPLRRKMIQVMEEKGRVTVTELYVALRLEQSVYSQHLAILRKLHVVNANRDGQLIYYSVNHDRLSHYLERFSGLFTGHSAGSPTPAGSA